MAQQIYTVEIDGVEYDLEGDHPPTEAEARAAIATSPPPETPAAPEPLGTVSADEPGDWWGGARKGLVEGMEGGSRGFLKGVLPGAGKAVLGLASLPLTVADMAMKTGAGAANLLTSPVDTLTGAYRNVKDMVTALPGQVAETTDAAARQARTDPEGFGRNVGELTGALETGLGMAAVAPLAPKPVVRFVGSKLKAVGEQGKWPIRMMGAHQLGSGNLAGLGTIMAPEMMAKTGDAMVRFGTPAGAATATSAGRLSQLQADIVKLKETPDPTLLADVKKRIAEMRAVQDTARKAAKLPEDIAAIQKEQNRLDQLAGQVKAPTRTTSDRNPSPASVVDDLPLSVQEAALVKQGVSPEAARAYYQKTGPVPPSRPPDVPIEPQPAPLTATMAENVVARQGTMPRASRTSRGMSDVPGYSVEDARFILSNPKAQALQVELARATRQKNYIEADRLKKELQRLLDNPRQ